MMSHQQWLAMAGFAAFGGFLITVGLVARYLSRKQYEWLKKNGRI
jgi:hypothetical protein